MKRYLKTTADGSTTLVVEGWGEPYHSMHGAIREACHVFINMGFRHLDRSPVHILEMGFGTGLNALITLMEARATNKLVRYRALEAYPVTGDEIARLNYITQLDAAAFREAYMAMHDGPWDCPLGISDTFTLFKQQCDFTDFATDDRFHLIYFDAFGAQVQPELWTEAIFSKMHEVLLEGGVLVTYAAKGSVRRAMQAVGFDVERLPGPPGKREMLRATKKST